MSAAEKAARRGQMFQAALAFGRQPISRRGRRMYDGALLEDGSRRPHWRRMHKAHIRKVAVIHARAQRATWFKGDQ